MIWVLPQIRGALQEGYRVVRGKGLDLGISKIRSIFSFGRDL